MCEFCVRSFVVHTMSAKLGNTVTTVIESKKELPNDFATKNIFRPIILALTFSGFHFVSKENKIIYILRRLFFALLSIASTIIVISKFVWLIKANLNFNAELVENLVSGIWLIEAMISMVYLYHWQVCDRISSFFSLFHVATGQKGIESRKKFIFVFQLFLLIMGILFVAVSSVAYADSLFEGVNLNISYSHWSGLLFGYKQMNWLIFVCIFFLCIFCYLALVIFNLLCTCLKFELSYMNKQMEALDNIDVENLEIYFNLHENLLKVVDHANATFSVFILFMLCGDLPIIILLIYSFFNVRATLLQYFILSTWLIFTLGHLLSLSLIPASVNDAVIIKEYI